MTHRGEMQVPLRSYKFTKHTLQTQKDAFMCAISAGGGEGRNLSIPIANCSFV